MRNRKIGQRGTNMPRTNFVRRYVTRTAITYDEITDEDDFKDNQKRDFPGSLTVGQVMDRLSDETPWSTFKIKALSHITRQYRMPLTRFIQQADVSPVSKTKVEIVLPNISTNQHPNN